MDADDLLREKFGLAYHEVPNRFLLVVEAVEARIATVAIIAEYNRETDRVTIEKTFEDLVKLVGDMGVEDQRAVREELNDEKLAVFDLTMPFAVAWVWVG